MGLLLGNREIHEDVPYVFVDGALEMETVAKDGEKESLQRMHGKRPIRKWKIGFPNERYRGGFYAGIRAAV